MSAERGKSQWSTMTLAVALLGWVTITMVGGVSLATAMQQAGAQCWSDVTILASFGLLFLGLVAIGLRAGG